MFCKNKFGLVLLTRVASQFNLTCLVLIFSEPHCRSPIISFCYSPTFASILLFPHRPWHSPLVWRRQLQNFTSCIFEIVQGNPQRFRLVLSIKEPYNMAHTLASDMGTPARDADDPEISIIDPDQEQDIIYRRSLLSQFQRDLGDTTKDPAFSYSTPFARKRNRGWYVLPLFLHPARCTSLIPLNSILTLLE